MAFPKGSYHAADTDSQHDTEMHRIAPVKLMPSGLLEMICTVKPILQTLSRSPIPMWLGYFSPSFCAPPRAAQRNNGIQTIKFLLTDFYVRMWGINCIGKATPRESEARHIVVRGKSQQIRTLVFIRGSRACNHRSYCTSSVPGRLTPAPLLKLLLWDVTLQVS